MGNGFQATNDVDSGNPLSVADFDRMFISSSTKTSAEHRKRSWSPILQRKHLPGRDRSGRNPVVVTPTADEQTKQQPTADDLPEFH